MAHEGLFGEMICPNPACRTPVLEGAAFCHRCGWPLRNDAGRPTGPATIVVAASGRRFPLARADILVGRYDPASPPFPDIDLSGDDPNRTVSRHHARFLLRGGQYLLRLEDDARNPGEMDGAPLVTGVLIALKDGDRFSLGRVELQFLSEDPNPARPTVQLGGLL